MAAIPVAKPLWSVPEQMQMGPGALQESGWSQSDRPEYAGGPWQVVGDDSQMVFVTLQPGETLMSEPGGLLTADSGVTASANVGGGSLALKRVFCAQESCLRINWTNTTSEPKVVSVGPPFTAKMVPINLDIESGIRVKSKAWVASPGTKTDFDAEMLDFKNACCAGQGCCVSTLTGTGTAFLGLGGTVIEKTLKPGEVIVVDQPSVVAWSKEVTMDSIPVGGCIAMSCGGMGCFNVTFTGPGKVYLQSMSADRAVKGYQSLLVNGKRGVDAPIS